MRRWVLYGTAACHLCEQAEMLLRDNGLGHDKIDIAGDDALLVRYGVRIPVLYDQATGRELGWSFDDRSLRHFIEAEDA